MEEKVLRPLFDIPRRSIVSVEHLNLTLNSEKTQLDGIELKEIFFEGVDGTFAKCFLNEGDDFKNMFLIPCTEEVYVIKTLS